MVRRNKTPSLCRLFIIPCIFLSGCAVSSSVRTVTSGYAAVAGNYQAAIKKNPRDIQAKLSLARFYYKFNDYEKVKDLLAAVTAREGKIILAKALAKLKEYPVALDIFMQTGDNRGDGEYMYLYGFALESQNLFPHAVKIYHKVKGPFKKKALERLANIGAKIKEGVPGEIKKILSEEKNFLAGIVKEEAVYLLVDETTRIKNNNNSVSTLHVIQKVLKEKGKAAAEVEIGYDSSQDRVELQYARTITPQGRVVYAGAQNIRDVSKYLNFPLYSNARAFIISMPAVEVGSIIEYKAKIFSSQLITEDKFSFLYRLREAHPVARAALKLIVPSNRKINFKFLNRQYCPNINLAPKKEEKAGEKIYSWHFKRISPIIPEDNMPEVAEINPGVAVSSFNDWAQVYNWWYPLFKDKIVLNKEIKEFTAKLIAGSSGPREKARRIYEFCARNIRYVAVEYGASGYEPHKAEEIFLNRYGDCKDKAILLVAMLRQAGLQAYPVLIPTRHLYPISEDFPMVYFNHAIAVLAMDGKFIFMDATVETTSLGDLPVDDQERKTLVITDSGYKIIETPRLRNNEINYQMTVDIDQNENAKITRVVTSKGLFSAARRFYFKYTHPQQVKDDLANKMTEISPFSKLTDYKIENTEDFTKEPLLTYAFESKKLLSPADNLRIFAITADVGIGTSYAAKEAGERVYGVEFEAIFKKSLSLKVTLPGNLKVKYLPRDKEINSKWFKFRSDYRQSPGSIDIYRELAVNERFIRRDDYTEFKKQMEEVYYLLKEDVILEKTGN